MDFSKVLFNKLYMFTISSWGKRYFLQQIFISVTTLEDGDARNTRSRRKAGRQYNMEALMHLTLNLGRLKKKFDLLNIGDLREYN